MLEERRLVELDARPIRLLYALMLCVTVHTVLQTVCCENTHHIRGPTMTDLMLNDFPHIASAPASKDHRMYARCGYAAVALVFGGLGLWASLAPLDRAAIAQGQVTVDSNNKPIQHLEGGIVREILVRDTQQVKEGDVLIRLQPTSAQANLDLLRKQIDVSLATEARLVAEQIRAYSISFPAELLAHRNIAETELAISDQERQFRERRQTLDGQIGILASQIEQKQQEMAGRGSPDGGPRISAEQL